MTKFTEPRPLTRAERRLLDFLLSAEFPGRDELKAQAAAAQAVGACECGCGAIDLTVHHSAPRSSCREPIPVEAYDTNTEVLLFVRDGALSSIQIVGRLGNQHPTPYPRLNELTLWPWRPSLSASGA